MIGLSHGVVVYISTTPADMWRGFDGLSGKQLAIIHDARMERKCSAITERLLSISGEDSLNINRKNLSFWTGQLKTKLMLCSYELPRFGDASGALPARMIILRMTKSFLGEEDFSLEADLGKEMRRWLKLFW